MTTPVMPRSAAAMLEGILGAGLLMAAAFGIVRPLVGPAGLGWGDGPLFGAPPSVPATLDLAEVDVRTDPVLASLSGRGEVASGDGLEISVPTSTEIVVHDPDLSQVVGLLGPTVLTGLLAVTVLFLLLRVVRTLRDGDPFVPANARRLYAIAAAVAAGQGVVFLEAWGRADVISHPAVAPYVLYDAEITVLPLVLGLGIAVLAEVFRQGAALRADVEGLV